MKRIIEVIVSADGQIKIEALGFTGPDCEKATAFLEKALGVIKEHRKKPEYYTAVKQGNHQAVGGGA